MIKATSVTIDIPTRARMVMGWKRFGVLQFVRVDPKRDSSEGKITVERRGSGEAPCELGLDGCHG